MAPLSMLELAERFDPTPLVPPRVREEQERRLKRLDIPYLPESAEASSWDYMVDCLAFAELDRTDPLAGLQFSLLNARPQAKFFLTGHKGAGKSTRLNALLADDEIRRRFQVIALSIKDYLNMDTAAPEQLQAVLIANVIEEIKDLRGEAEAGRVGASLALDGLKKVLHASLPGLKLDSLDIKILGVLSAKFKESSDVRDAFKKYTSSHPAALPDVLNQLLDSLEVGLDAGKELLIVVDDTDKLGADAARAFFAQELPQLLRPRARMIYTYPIGLGRIPEFSGLKEQSRFEVRHARVMADRHYGSFVPVGIKIMTAFIERRLDGPLAHYLDPELLPALFFYSFGNFRELARLLRNGLMVAAQYNITRFDRTCLDAALRSQRQDYSRFFYSHRNTMRLVHSGEFDVVDEARLGPLMDGSALVEYPNDPGWLDVHPVVGDLLAERSSPRDNLPALP